MGGWSRGGLEGGDPWARL